MHPPASLLVACMHPVCALLAPFRAGAWTPRRHTYFTDESKAASSKHEENDAHHRKVKGSTTPRGTGSSTRRRARVFVHYSLSGRRVRSLEEARRSSSRSLTSQGPQAATSPKSSLVPQQAGVLRGVRLRTPSPDSNDVLTVALQTQLPRVIRVALHAAGGESHFAFFDRHPKRDLATYRSPSAS